MSSQPEREILQSDFTITEHTRPPTIHPPGSQRADGMSRFSRVKPVRLEETCWPEKGELGGQPSTFASNTH
jgi:hypothetical protein